MKYPFVFVLFLISCARESVLQIAPLSPISYSFEVDTVSNRIDYFYIEDGYLVPGKKSYSELQQKLASYVKEVPLADYALYSIYVYKETEVLGKDYIGGKYELEGHNKDVVAYIRYANEMPDIGYLIQEGTVKYDGLTDEKVVFDFK